jgi:hypothetical protein
LLTLDRREKKEEAPRVQMNPNSDRCRSSDQERSFPMKDVGESPVVALQGNITDRGCTIPSGAEPSPVWRFVDSGSRNRIRELSSGKPRSRNVSHEGRYFFQGSGGAVTWADHPDRLADLVADDADGFNEIRVVGKHDRDVKAIPEGITKEIGSEVYV